MGPQSMVSQLAVVLCLLVQLVNSATAVELRIPCTAVANGTNSDIRLADHLGTTSPSTADVVLFFEGCSWEDANVRFLFSSSSPTLSIRRVVSDGGSFVAVAEGPTFPHGSRLEVVGTVAVGCATCYGIESAAEIAHVSLYIAHSSLHATYAVASLLSSAAVKYSSIEILDSSLEVVSPTAAFAACLNSTTVSDTAITVTSSIVQSVSVGDSCAVGIITRQSSMSVQNVLLHASATAIKATGSAAVASMGFASSSHSASTSKITAYDVTIYASNSSATSTGTPSSYSAVASMGFACTGTASTTIITAHNVTIYASNCTATTMETGSCSASALTSMGFASSSPTPASAISADNITIYAFNAHATTSTIGLSYSALTSMGFACNSPSSTSTIAAHNIVIYASDSTVATSGTGSANSAVTSMGFATCSRTSSISTITAEICVIYASNSSVATTGTGSYPAVASMGFACISPSATATITAHNVTIYASDSMATTTGSGSTYSAVTSMGIATYSYDSYSKIAAHNITLYAANSSATTSASGSTDSAVSSVGFASYSHYPTSDSVVIAAQLLACRSTVRVTSCIGSCAVVSSVAGAWSGAASFVIVDSDFSSPYDCFGVAPPDVPSLSVACNLSLRCDTFGWGDPHAGGSVGMGIRSSGILLNITQRFKGMAASNDCPTSYEACASSVGRPAAPNAPTAPTTPNAPAMQGHSHTMSIGQSASRSFAASASTSTTRSASEAPTSSTSHFRSDSPSSMPSLSRSTTTSPTNVLHIAVAPVLSPAESMSTLMPPSAAQAVVVTSSGAAVLTGVFASPGAAVAATRIGLVIASVDCQFNDDSMDPQLTQYPLSTLVVSSGLTAHAIGVVSCVALTLAVVAADTFLLYTKPKKPILLARALEATLHQYFGPSVACGTVLVLRHSTVWGHIAFVSAAALTEVALLSHRAYKAMCCSLECTRSPQGARGTVKSAWSGGPVTERYGPFFEMCRSSRLVVRCAFFVELSASMLMGCIAGWRPPSGSSCTEVAAGMLLIAGLLFLYLAIYRPYSTMQDTAFSLCFAALQVVQAACAVGCAQNSSTALAALAYVTVLQSFGLVVQMACAISWRIVVNARRASLFSHQRTPAACRRSFRCRLCRQTRLAVSCNPSGSVDGEELEI